MAFNLNLASKPGIFKGGKPVSSIFSYRFMTLFEILTEDVGDITSFLVGSLGSSYVFVAVPGHCASDLIPLKCLWCSQLLGSCWDSEFN